MVIYATPCVDILYLKEDKILLIKWKISPDYKEFTSAYLVLIELATSKYPTTFFCTDLSSIGSLKNEQEVWLNTEYYNLVFESIETEIYAAVVFSVDHFKAIISNYKATDVEVLHSFIHFNYFTSSKEACHWLSSIKKGQDALVYPDSFS